MKTRRSLQPYWRQLFLAFLKQANEQAIAEQWFTSHIGKGASPHSHCTILHCTPPTALKSHCIIPHCTLHHCTRIILHCTVPHCTTACCTILRCTAPIAPFPLRHPHFITAKPNRGSQKMNIEMHHKNAFDFDHILTICVNI